MINKYILNETTETVRITTEAAIIAKDTARFKRLCDRLASEIEKQELLISRYTEDKSHLKWYERKNRQAFDEKIKNTRLLVDIERSILKCLTSFLVDGWED